MKENFFTVLSFIDSCIAERKFDKEFLTLVKQEKYRAYFFRTLIKDEDNVELCHELSEIGLLDISQMPNQHQQWDTLSYLRLVSEKKSKDYQHQMVLFKAIRDITQYQLSKNETCDNRTSTLFIRILSNLPSTRIPDEIMNLIPSWLNTRFGASLQGQAIGELLLPHLLRSNNPENWRKAEKVVLAITEPKKSEVRSTSPEGTVVEKYWLEKAFKKNAKELGKKCSKEFLEEFGNRISELITIKHEGLQEYSHHWFPSFFKSYEEPQSIYSTIDLLLHVYGQLILIKAKKEPDIATAVLLSYLKKDSPLIFQRLILYCATENWNVFKSLFVSLYEEWQEGLFEIAAFEPELSQFLQKRFNSLPTELQDTIKAYLSVGEPIPAQINDEEKRKWYQKSKWLQCLTADKECKKTYQELKEKLDLCEHDFFYGIQSYAWSGPGPSPMPMEKLQEASNSEIVQFIKNFNQAEMLTPDTPTLGGLVADLHERIGENPQKYSDDLNPFIDTGYYCVSEILRGFRNAWVAKKEIDWGNILSFINNYIQKEGFWKDEFCDKSLTNHRWVIGETGLLIQQGCRDDAWAFPKELMVDVQKVLFFILANLKAEQSENADEISRDFVSHHLNSAEGKTITALLYLALRYSRMHTRETDKREGYFEPSLRTKFDELLSSESLDAYSLFGYYLSYFHYLDEAWTRLHVKSLEQNQQGLIWEAFMDGYLSSGRVFDTIYPYMRSHYARALRHGIKNGKGKERLIDHIVIAYLRGHEELDKKESLFFQLLEEWDTEKIGAIVWYCWTLRDIPDTDENRTFKQKILSFWEWSHENKLKKATNPSSEERKFMCKFSFLTPFLRGINESTFPWLLTIAPYAEEDWKAYILIDFLDAIENPTELKYVGEIFLRMLERCLPTFEEEKIKSIVEKLYKAGEKSNTDLICIKYGEGGREDLLRDIYERYNA